MRTSLFSLAGWREEDRGLFRSSLTWGCRRRSLGRTSMLLYQELDMGTQLCRQGVNVDVNIPAPRPFSPFSNSSRRRKLRGIFAFIFKFQRKIGDDNLLKGDWCVVAQGGLGRKMTANELPHERAAAPRYSILQVHLHWLHDGEGRLYRGCNDFDFLLWFKNNSTYWLAALSQIRFQVA